MAVNDIPWTGRGDAKMYMQSGNVTTTMKTSLATSSWDTFPWGIEADADGNMTLNGREADKFYLMSGAFSSTIKDSISTAAQTGSPLGPSEDGVNTTLIYATVLCLYSGKITTTVKTSLDITSVDGSVNGCSTFGTTTLVAATQFAKRYWLSGQFTTTIKDSSANIDGGEQAICHDGTDTNGIGSTANIIYVASGLFTTTVKSSISIAAIDTTPNGVSTNNVTGGRMPALDNTGDVVFDLPALWQNNPQTISLPQLTVWGGSGATGDVTLPAITMVAEGTPANVIVDITFPMPTVSSTATGMGGEVNLPQLTIVSSSNPGNNTIDLTLPQIVLTAGNFNRCTASLTMPRFTFETVAQQGTVENIEITMPMLTVNIQAGKTVDLELPVLSVVVSGQNGFVGTFNKSLPVPIVNVKASQTIIGTSYLSLPSPTFTTSLLTGVVSLTGGNRTLPTLILNAHAFRGENGDVAITLPVFSLTNEVALNPSGTFSNSLFALTLDAYADVHTNRFI